MNPFSVCAPVEVSPCTLCPGHPLALLSSNQDGPSKDLNIIDHDTTVVYCSLRVWL